MTDEPAHESQMGLAIEKMWTMFQETEQHLRETLLRLKEIATYMDRRFKELDRKISRLDSRIDDMVDQLIIPNLLGSFCELGYEFDRVAPHIQYFDSEGCCIQKVDLLLDNADTALVVDVTMNLTVTDVENHVKRMEMLRCFADEHGGKQKRQKLLGAVAGVIALEGEKAFAIKQGFFVLEQTGDTVQVRVPKGFKPKEW
jgi:hypothetical protein